ncbi:multiple monosaccharide ABC transporter permease [Quadrisphaera sp. INWT6]|uniref:multiple monosaccharide ABC transporter permease n=1 Tax=Quadrisphaera sp. INWT6 TaxID=2596917 RepID=UPI00189248AB|nr:multiple monosaccharide ABC transporter permease [Quadrisphaera sp. INWT6]MBF5081817.1 sugar ABC transporter permease [Quadrisphaera sp. INWT6]
MSTSTTAPAKAPEPKTGSANPLVALTANLRQSGIYIAFVLVVALFAVLTDGRSLAAANVSTIVTQYAYVLVLAIGMLIVIVAGHIDLSVGSVLAVVGAVAARLAITYEQPWWVAALAALAVGIVIGAWQGFWVAYVGVPAFIVTLAGMLLFRGLDYLVLENISLSGFPPAYSKIATGYLNGLMGGYGYDAFTLLIGALAVVGFVVQQLRTRRARVKYQQTVEALPVLLLKIVIVAAVVMWFAYQLATARGLPIVLILLAVLILAYAVITKSTVFGRQVYAIGGNLSAAMLSGVNVRKVNFWIFVNMGFLAGIAGVIFSAYTNGAQPAAGTGAELDAIAAAFIGGAAVTGGVGTIVGAMVGGLLVAVINNGMIILGLGQEWQFIIRGMVLLLAVAFDVYNKRRSGTR